MVDIVVQARREFVKPFFAEVIFLTWWNIWTVRNGKVFRKVRPNVWEMEGRFYS